MQEFMLNLKKKALKNGYIKIHPLIVKEVNPSIKDYALFLYRTNFQESMLHSLQKQLF